MYCTFNGYTYIVVRSLQRSCYAFLFFLDLGICVCVCVWGGGEWGNEILKRKEQDLERAGSEPHTCCVFTKALSNSFFIYCPMLNDIVPYISLKVRVWRSQKHCRVHVKNHCSKVIMSCARKPGKWYTFQQWEENAVFWYSLIL